MPPTVPGHWPTPEFGDILRCRFPFQRHHGQPNNEWHPCLVWLAIESNQVEGATHLLLVSFGTTLMPTDKQRERFAENVFFTIDASDSKDDPARTHAGLSFTTTFWLMKENEECLRWIPYNDEWFVPIAGGSGHPKHGSLRAEISLNKPPPDDKATIWIPPVGLRLLEAAKRAGVKQKLIQEGQAAKDGIAKIG